MNPVQQNIINYEFKAKVECLTSIEEKLKELNADCHGEDLQVDHYFDTSNGRLKMRLGNIENALIHYKRANDASSKKSEITLEKTDRESNLARILEQNLGLLVEVKKLREIFFIDNVKFHLDKHESLGTFFEVEAIDIDGSIGLEKLKEQCDYYANLFNINSDQFIDVSYSDLVLENEKNEFYSLGENFLTRALSFTEENGISSINPTPDHLCYRCEDFKTYLSFKAKLKKWGNLLVASEIGGREISTFRLDKPIEFNGHKVSILELPAPKEGKFCNTGFEHAEFVTTTDLKSFAEQHENLKWDYSALDKTHNPELKLNIEENFSLKFHTESLENLVRQELFFNV